ESALVIGGRVAPHLRAVVGIQAIDAVVARTDVNLPVAHRRARFGLPLGRETPDFSAVFGVDTEDIAACIVVEAFAEKKLAIVEAWSRDHLPQVVVLTEELPFFQASLAIEPDESGVLRRFRERSVDGVAGDDR